MMHTSSIDLDATTNASKMEDISSNDAQTSEDLLEKNPKFTLHQKPLLQQLQQMYREFEELERTSQNSVVNFTTSIKMAPLNRYCNIAANEASIFPPTKDEPLLYINGNLMEMGLDRQFVASQAPVPEGLGMFYATLIRYQISLVLMVTKEVESNVRKADPYWPQEGSRSCPCVYGDFVLWKEPDTPQRPSYYTNTALQLNHRTFFVQQASEWAKEKSGSDSSAHRVRVIEYVGWPDHGVPASVDSFRSLLQRVEEEPKETLTLVHCSAGVGRTATLIGGYAALYHARRGSFTDRTLPELVQQMRGLRFGSVQRVEQYMFMYQTIMSFLGISVEDLSKEIGYRAAEFQARMLADRR